MPDPEDESRGRGRSVVDYVITGRGDEGNIFDAGVLGRHKADIGSDHNALFIITRNALVANLTAISKLRLGILTEQGEGS